MSRNKQIAILLPDTLQRQGIHYLLADYFPPFQISHFDSFDSFGKTTDSFDFYFTNCEIFMQNLDFFLLRRNRTFCLTDASGAPSPAGSLLIPRQAPVETILEILQPVLTSEHSPASCLPDNNKELSGREISVLQQIVKGYTNKEIADFLNISLNTVLSHRKNITTKLGIKTVSGLTFYAIMNGIVSGDEIEL